MNQPLLPPGFAWHRQVIGGVHRDAYLLTIGGRHGLEVAMVERRITEGWLAEVNRHQDRPGRAVATSLEVARRWVNQWAQAHAGRLRTCWPALVSDDWLSHPAAPDEPIL